MRLTVRAVNDLSSVDPAAWDALDHGASPFLEHGFLRALEITGTIGEGSGWAPVYVLVEEDAQELAEPTGSSAATARGNPSHLPKLVGAVACFCKSHSYGEYIFDWGWARASARANIPYYPKLVIAAPVTPATGPRLLLPREDSPAAVHREQIASLLIDGVYALADALEVSSVHWLFTTAPEHQRLREAGFMPRASFQFHWKNTGYDSFDAFLSTLSSRKRKQIRKERRRAQAQIDDLQFVAGSDMSDADVAALDRFYRTTCLRHGGQDYLRPGFFEQLRAHLPHRVQFARVRRDGETVAGALYLQTERALYGRYWGCREEIEFLHFETAYYAGIERCIEQGLELFEAGAQGEHKLLRGFSPAATYSSHWIRHEGLRDAVSRFLAEERAALPDYMKELEQFAPYKKAADGSTSSDREPRSGDAS